jgi:hypothetical protein
MKSAQIINITIIILKFSIKIPFLLLFC